MATSVCLKEQQFLWMGSETYNTIPGIEETREVVSEEKQKDVTICLSKKLAGNEILSSLLAQIGTTLTHRALSTKTDQVVAGVLVNGKILRFQKMEKSSEIYPITWAIWKNQLVAIKGMMNPSSDVVNVVKKVYTYANEIIPFFAEEKLSKLSLTIDLRLMIQDKKAQFFKESSSEDIYMISKHPAKPKETSKYSYIPVYLPTRRSQEDERESSMKTHYKSWYELLIGCEEI